MDRLLGHIGTSNVLDGQHHTVDGCDILHQLKTEVYPTILLFIYVYMVSAILLVVQDFATTIGFQAYLSHLESFERFVILDGETCFR